MTIPTIDYQAATEDELRAMAKAVESELTRRISIASAPSQMESLIRAVQEAEGRKMGDPWKQPTEATRSYLKGFEVTDGGKRWRNVVNFNVWRPGVAGWREITPDGSPAPWVQPAGSDDAYSKGERAKGQDGTVYTSLVDGNGWPLSNTTAWKKEEPASTGGTTPPPSGGSGGTTQPAVPLWSPDADYKTGDKVMFAGYTYQAIQAHHAQAGWTPQAVPSLWKQI